MTPLSTFRERSWSTCGEQEGECMRGEVKVGGKWPRNRFYSFIGNSLAVRSRDSDGR